jgi:hydroxyethylthiazole kinase-like uncharacterized protein yjeF
VVEPLLLDDAACARLLPDRTARAHKGSHGTLACVCGSLDYAGAALLCGMAAARVGAGLVALAVPAALQPLLAGRVPELVTLGLPEDAAAAVAAIEARRPSALVVGCGLAEDEPRARLVEALTREGSWPAVVDGGALNLLARAGDWWSSVRPGLVLTPHPGEFARLTGQPMGDDDAQRAASAAEAAARFGQVVVLKGARTVIAAPDGRLARAPFENPALASAGTGDVLAGAIGGLLAQGVEPYEASCLGVYLQGCAGERIAERIGDSGLLASDLPLEMAHVRHQLQRRKGGRGAEVGFGRRADG